MASEIHHPPSRLNGIAVWSIAAFCIIGTLAGVWLNGQIPSDDPQRASAGYYLWIGLQGTLPPIVAALILSHKPGHAVGMAFMAFGLCFGIGEALLPGYANWAVVTDRLWLPLVSVAIVLYEFLWLAGLLAMGLALLYFPTGRLPSKRWRWVPGLMGLASLVFVGSGSYFFWGMPPKQIQLGDAAITDPLYPIITGVGFLAALSSVAGAITSFFVRLRRVRGVERQQMKWFSLSIALYLTLALVQLVPPLIIPMKTDPITALVGDVGFNLFHALMTVVIFVSAAIAILRHKAFDIDIIIRKTLQWTLVTLLLGAVYVACVLGLQEAFKRLTGQTSDAAVALSTLALAVAFMPIRRAVQNLIDKRFYRKRYNAEKVIEAYAASIKDEVDTAVIHQKMLAVLADTLQPKKIVLFLAQPHPHPRFAPLPKRERE